MDLGDRVTELERWRTEEVDPQLRALVSLDLPGRMDDLEAKMTRALDAFTRTNHDIRESAELLSGNAQLMKAVVLSIDAKLTKLLTPIKGNGGAQ